MADEFIKGFGILTVAGLGWMVLSGWYTTPGFEDTQLVGTPPAADALSVYGNLGLILRDALGWFAIIGALTFWVLIPAYREARRAYGGESD